jgi:primosomal replication protein N
MSQWANAIAGEVGIRSIAKDPRQELSGGFIGNLLVCRYTPAGCQCCEAAMLPHDSRVERNGKFIVHSRVVLQIEELDI